MNTKKGSFCIGFVCLLGLLVFFVPRSFAEIFAWEYNNCIQKCMPKEKCCKETCGYKACIKHNTTRETAIGAELTDPGAGDTAMAVCYPHLDVMKKCFDQNKIQGSEDLKSVIEEYCSLVMVKTKEYPSKEVCTSSTMENGKRSGKSAADLIKNYKVAIEVLNRKQ